MLRRHRRVFDKRLRPRFPGNVAKQAHRAFAHAIDLVHRRLPDRQRMPEAFDRGVAAQVFEEGFDPALQIIRIITAELHQVDPQCRPFGALRKVFGDAVPDDVLHGQQQHFGVDGFNRQRLERHQRPGIAQRIHEPGVADVHQHGVFGNRQHVELGLDHKPQRTFGAAQHAVEVEAIIGLAQVRQVVAGQAAVEIRKALFDQFALLINDLPRAAIDFADPVFAGAQRCQIIFGQCFAVQALAAAQDHVEFQHMVTGLAIGATALAAGVGVDHAANGGAVGGRQLRGEEQPGRLQRSVELVLDHPGLHAHPALFDVDLQNAVHVPRQVDHDAVGQRLTVGAGAAATRGDHHFPVSRLGDQACNPRHILGVHREHRRLRQALIDRVVGGEHHATGVIGADFTTKAAGFQGVEELLVIGAQCAGGRQLGNHRSVNLGQNRAVWR